MAAAKESLLYLRSFEYVLTGNLNFVFIYFAAKGVYADVFKAFTCLVLYAGMNLNIVITNIVTYTAFSGCFINGDALYSMFCLMINK